MGSCFVTEIFEGKLNQSEMRRQYEARLAELSVAYGSDAYNGTLTTTQGLFIDDRTFDSRQAAEEYVMSHTQKWEEARAVKFKDVRTEVAKAPTFDGKPASFSYSATLPHGPLRTVTAVLQDQRRVPIAADQLKTSQKATAVALYSDYHAKAQEFGALHKAVRAMLGQMEPADSVPPTTAELRELQKASKQRLKAHGVLKKAEDKLGAFDTKHSAKLYATKQVDYGTQWLVGGWAAE